MKLIHWREGISHEEWLEERLRVSGVGTAEMRIGASDISTLTGSNKWKSKRRLYLEKVGYHKKDFRNKMTLLGNEMEPVIAQLMERYNTDEEIFLDNRQYNTPQGYLKKAEFFAVNSKYPNLVASIDYIPNGEFFSPWTGEQYPEYTPFELKNIQQFVYQSWGESIPLHYYEQVQVQMAMVDAEIAVFAPFISNGDFMPVEVRRDESLIQYLSHVATEFAIDVTKGKILKEKIDASEDEREIHDLRAELEGIVPFDDLKDEYLLSNELKVEGEDFLEVTMGSKEEEAMEAYFNANESIKEAEEIKNKQRAIITYMADGYKGIDTPYYKATVRGDNGDKKAYFRVTKKGVK